MKKDGATIKRHLCLKNVKWLMFKDLKSERKAK
jgi:hypothetical protein